MGRTFSPVLVTMCALWVCTAATAGAGDGRTEVGVVPFTLMRGSWGDENVTSLGVPAGSAFLPLVRGVYLQRFVTDKAAIEPQLSAAAFFEDGSEIKTISIALRASYLVNGPDRPTVYAAAGVGVLHMDGFGDSETHPVLCVALGFRRPIGTAGSLRIEMGYEHVFESNRYMDEGIDVLSAAVGFALRF